MLGKKIGSLLLAAALTVSGLAVPAKAAEEHVQSNLAVHYDMTHEGDYLKDVSGNGNNAKMYRIDDGDFREEYGDAVLKFPGTDGAYAELPASIKDHLNYKDAFTIEMTLKPNTAQFQFLWTIGTGYQTDYLFFNPRLGGEKKNMNLAIKTDGVGQENAIPGAQDVVLDTTGYSLVTVTSSGNTLKLYVNGNEIGTLDHTHNLDTIFAGKNGVLGYLAKSNWNDPYCDADVTDFKIYNETLSANDVKSNYDKMEVLKVLQADAADLTLPAYTMNDLALTERGASGSSVTWSSSDESVLSSAGKIMKQTPGADSVTLTATIKDNATGVIAEKDFQIEVVTGGDEGKLEYIAKQFDPGISYVTEDITLATESEGASIEWTGNEWISKDGKVTRPEKDTQVTLKARFTMQGIAVEKEYVVTVAGKTAGYLASYVAKYEHNVGPEFAEFPAHKYEGFTPLGQYDYSRYSDNVRTDVMFYGISDDGKEYKALNSDKAVLYPKGKLQMGSPSLFRKADGTYGAIASVNNTQPQVMIWDSEDLIFFENQRTITLNNQGVAVKNPTVKYDNAAGKYEVYWEGGNGKSYVSRSADLLSFEAAEQTQYRKENVSGKLPIYASTEEASVFELTATEKERIEKKYGEIYSVDVETKDVQAQPGEKITLSDKVDVVYNDGSKKSMGVDWDVKGSGLDLDNPKEGTYTVKGTVKQEVYNSPIAPCRADPYVIYNEQDGMYYFTSSYMQSDLKNPYAKLILRRAKTLNDLTNAEEVTIWDGSKGTPQPYYWAPEFHYMGGYWRIIALSTINNQWRMTIFTCTGGDVMNPDHWEYTGVVENATNGMALGAFDTTYFEYEGKSYYVSPAGGNIHIVTVDPTNPLKPTGPLIAISTPTYAWEYNITTKQDIEEGSAVMIHDGKIYITYAASTVDMNYAVGLLYADLDDDIMDPASWTKYPYPVLSTPDLTTTIQEPDFANAKDGSYEGTFGPGHNSLTVDQNGNPVIIYHARDWADDYTKGSQYTKYGLEDPGRHAYAANIHFGADGFPIFNMTSEQELADDLKEVTMKVVVKERGGLPYVDVAEDAWYYNAVYYNYFEETMTGINPKHFAPDENLARAQFAIILHRMNNTPKMEYTNTFADVAANEWYTDAILWAASKGVVTGYTDGSHRFGWGDNILREQMAVMMYRYADYKGYDRSNKADFGKFDDASKVSEYAVDAMKWAVGNGIITGKDLDYNGTPETIDPQGNATRAECATIIQRFKGKFEK